MGLLISHRMRYVKQQTYIKLNIIKLFIVIKNGDIIISINRMISPHFLAIIWVKHIRRNYEFCNFAFASFRSTDLHAAAVNTTSVELFSAVSAES